MPWPKAWVPLPVLSRRVSRASPAICSLPGINVICITMPLYDSDKTERYRHLGFVFFDVLRIVLMGKITTK